MKLQNRWSSLFLFAIGMGVSLLSRRLPLGSLREPKEGFTPFFFGLILGGLSLLNFFLEHEKKRGYAGQEGVQVGMADQWSLSFLRNFVFPAWISAGHFRGYPVDP